MPLIDRLAIKAEIQWAVAAYYAFIQDRPFNYLDDRRPSRPIDDFDDVPF